MRAAIDPGPSPGRPGRTGPAAGRLSLGWVGPVLLGFGLGVLAAFVSSLLRRRSLVGTTGYVPPVAALGPAAVPPPAGTAHGQELVLPLQVDVR